MNFDICLFDDFETLDAFGPVEIFGKIPGDHLMRYLSQEGGMVRSAQGTKILTEPFSAASGGTLLIPGGMGTRKLVDDDGFIEGLSRLAKDSEYCLCVCTGSALLAKTGLLSGRSATSNKMAFEWVKSTDSTVNWVKKARWVVDGKFYTSSGVSAGIDMAFGFIADKFSLTMAQKIAAGVEYIWNSNKDEDPFAELY